MIVLLAMPYHPSRPSGGPNSVAYNTVEGLKSRHDRLDDEDINIIVLSSEGSSPRLRVVSDREYPRLTYVYYDTVRPHAVIGDLQSLITHLRLDRNVDVVHSHSLYDAVAGSVLGRKSLLTLHGIVWEEKRQATGTYSKMTFRIKERRFEYLIRNVAQIVAISPYVIETVRDEFDVDEDLFTVIENPISKDFFDLPARTDGDLLLCPAVVSPRKNQRALVRALGRLKREGHSFRAVFTGPVRDESYFQSIQKTADAVGVSEDVEFAGSIPHDELLELYVRASVVCLFSLQETAPMTVAEAMASGTPVVASDVGGTRYMIADDEHGYVVPPNDGAALADRLGRLLRDDELRSRFGSRARTEASRWQSERIAGDLIDLYADLETRGRDG